MREATASYQMEFVDGDRLSASYQRAALRVIVDEAKDEVYRTTPVGWTQNLRKSVEGKVINGGTTGLVTVKAAHAHLIHDGVSPHETRPMRRDREAVRFFDYAGDAVVRRVTHHPGTQGRPWVDEAVRKTKSRLDPLMRAAGMQVEGEYA